jgi:DNA repair photolyase
MTPELRTVYLGLFHDYHARVCFQSTWASCDGIIQRKVEPGAPDVEQRADFLADVVTAGVERASHRCNPLVPGLNDSDELIAATVDRAAKVDVSRYLCSLTFF